MIRDLAAAGLVEHQPYVGAVRSPRGQLRLKRVTRRRQLLELFLHQTLKLDIAAATEHATTKYSLVLVDRTKRPVLSVWGAAH